MTRTGWFVPASQGGIGYEKNSGYEPFISLDVSQDMHQDGNNPNTSCYIRVKFQVTESQRQQIGLLKLRIRYDDGFAAYLNQNKVAEANAPAQLSWQTAAAGNHEADEWNDFTIKAASELLRIGDNLLAIQGLNTGTSSSDFLITFELIDVPDPLKDFTSSNLPLVFIDTQGKAIPNDYRITAHLGVIDNGLGKRNSRTDAFNDYAGLINIEIRGSSSAGWRKKQYGFETQDELGNNRNVSLMGFPTENDWILNAPYIDKSLLRNVLTYYLSRQLGQYASRTKYCELFLNEEYQGIYILMEKIKRDKNRVAIAELDSSDTTGNALTGGYIIKIDKWGNDGFHSVYPPANGTNRPIFYQYHYPKDDVILPEQKNYIQNFIWEFEDVMASNDYNDPVKGYPKYLDIDSFIDFVIISELAKNVDSYRLSTFFYKQRDSAGGKLYAGPVWDYNLAFGLANYYDGEDTDDWMLEELTQGNAIRNDTWQMPFWWEVLFHEQAFATRLKKRWQTLRTTVLNLNRINSYIDAVADTLDEAQKRNFTIWTGPGEPKAGSDGFWPVPDIFYSFQSYQDEVDYLKSWIAQRIAWVDENIILLAHVENERPPFSKPQLLFRNFPNPFNATTVFTFKLPTPAHTILEVYNVTGQRVVKLWDKLMAAGTFRVEWDGLDQNGQSVASGIYFCHLRVDGANFSTHQSMKMVVVR